MGRPSHLLLSFPGEGVGASAELLWDLAPITCETIVDLLPLAGISHHAIYSGSECVLLLERLVKIPPENATSKVAKGDLGFAWMAAGSHYGVTQDFAEVCWFYDIDAEPRMWEGPVAVSIFARIGNSAEDFFAVCRRIRREGAKPFRVEAAER